METEGGAPVSVPPGGVAGLSSPSADSGSLAVSPDSGRSSEPTASLLPRMTYGEMESCPLLYVCCIASFFLTHALLVCLLRLSRTKSPLLAECAFPRHGVNRMISTLHACVVLNWSLLILLEEPPSRAVSGTSHCLFHFGRPVTDSERPMLLFSLSYFLYDTFYELASWDLSSVLHHVTSLIGLLNVLVADRGGTDLVMALLAAEFSTPALHLRYFLVQYAKRAEALAKTYAVESQAACARAELPAVYEQARQAHAAKEKTEACADDRASRGAVADATEEREKEKEKAFAMPKGGEHETGSVRPEGMTSENVESQAEGSQGGNDVLLVDKTSPRAVAHALGKYDFRGPLDAVERAFFFIFLCGRGIAAPCLVYACVTCGTTPVLVRAGSVGILVVSFFWMILLFRGLLKRLKSKTAKSRVSGGSAPWKPECRKREYSVCPPGEGGERRGDSRRDESKCKTG
ncbi:UNVERIFIED_CONTAM: hypothetical protein HHA_295080 [Hammondia hammondi]|eukprot:XP_008886841.1 hypothetical protein HHA_295080 [Hammondia hammondi]